jgi:hypothetical protein
MFKEIMTKQLRPRFGVFFAVSSIAFFGFVSDFEFRASNFCYALPLKIHTLPSPHVPVPDGTTR